MAYQKHADKGMPYIRLYTAMLNDDDLLDAGDAGRLLAVVLLLWSMDQGTHGYIPASARKVQRFAHLDGGVTAVDEGLSRLLEARFLTEADDDDTLLIRSWSRYQVHTTGPSTRADSNRKSALKQHHLAGKHTEAAKDGCGLCEEGHVVEVPQSLTAPAIEATPETPAGEDKLTAKAVKALVWDRCTTELEGNDPLGTYLSMARAVEKAAAGKWADVPRITEVVLANVVVSHAAAQLWNNGLSDTGVERQLHGLRKTHGTDAVLSAVVNSVGMTNPLAYTRGILRNEAAA